jgi:hypothetical protein
MFGNQKRFQGKSKYEQVGAAHQRKRSNLVRNTRLFKTQRPRLYCLGLPLSLTRSRRCLPLILQPQPSLSFQTPLPSPPDGATWKLGNQEQVWR